MKTRLHKASVLLLIPAVFLCFAYSLPGEDNPKTVDWPQFRGPNGSGLYETTGLPAELGPDTNVVWKRPLATGSWAVREQVSAWEGQSRSNSSSQLHSNRLQDAF